MTMKSTTARTSRIAILTTSLLLIAGTAAAGSSSDDPFDKPRTKLGFGMLVGGYTVGPVSGTGIGMHFELGRQSGPLYLYGEYDMLAIGESSIDVEDPIRGLLHRGSANLRYHLGEIGGKRVPVQGAFWIEGGVGQQRIHWHEGGKLTRNDISFGFGAQANFRISGRHAKKTKTIGFHYALKGFVARSPTADENAMPTCGGPCDEPTPPSPNDLGIFFNLGLEFGK